MIPSVDIASDWLDRAARLRQARLDQGVSLSAVAGRVSVTVSELGAIEAGNFQYFDSAQRVHSLLEKLESVLEPRPVVCTLFIPKFLREDHVA
ncbi:MAG: helix-turn-helix domain-containing protein [Burkholderiaceae bacterium]|jgi:transcriptional regulator with XRE-family HTH domain